ELTSLAHRKHYRAQEGLECWLRLRLDAIPVSKERYQRMSAPAQRGMIKSIQKIMAPLPLKKLAKAERSLEKVEKLIELFKPFILQNEHDFVADNIDKLSYALVDEEKPDFRYDTRSIDWWDYWINIHIPALRKWTYPLIEGRPLEARPARSFDLGAANGEAVKTGTNGATWRDRVDRIHRRACRRQFAGPAWGLSQCAGACARSARCGTEIVVGLAAALGFPPLLRIFADACACVSR
ncbi:MAG: hypothetical protein DMG88_17045, partial [Acidobacteria bacterium]